MSENQEDTAQETTTAEQTTAEELARREREASATMVIRPVVGPLAVAVVLWLIALFLPFAGDVKGYEVLLKLSAATEAGIKPTEQVYVILVTLGVGVLTTLTLLTRRSVVGLAAWAMTALGFLFSLFAIWIRQTRATADDGVNSSIGLWLMLLSVAVAAVSLSFVALRKNPEQEALSRARTRHVELDDVGAAQRSSIEEQRSQVDPFVDDRRARAAERFRAAENAREHRAD